MIKKPFRMAVVSDIHLGNRRTPAKLIIDNLNQHLTNDKVLAGVDILFLAGDVFDTILDFASQEVGEILLWIARTLTLCRRHNVLLRVLEGTPSHDRNQSDRFMTIKAVFDMLDVRYEKMRYVNALEIEHIEEFGIDVLYLPDQWGVTPEDDYDQVKKALAEKELNQVDFAIMHGAFEYQLPYPDAPSHNSQAYLDLVKYLIFIGHIHIRSERDRIFAQGSFDRISHGEEKPKGYYIADIETDGAYRVQFVENTTAAVYRTLVNTHEDMVDTLLWLDEVLQDHKEGDAIRLQARKDHPVFSNTAVLRERWPDFKWSFQPKDADTEEKKSAKLIDHKTIYQPLHLNRSNLSNVLIERMSKQGVDEDLKKRCGTLIESAIASV